jgi:hypothetical protein
LLGTALSKVHEKVDGKPFALPEVIGVVEKGGFWKQFCLP